MSPISSNLPSSALIIVAGVAALLIVVYLLVLSQNARTRTAGSPNIILVGPVGSGKTALFSQVYLWPHTCNPLLTDTNGWAAGPRASSPNSNLDYA